MFRGEVWRMSMAGSPRDEGAMTRTVVIVSSDALGALPLKVIVPLTHWKDEYVTAPWMVRVPPVLHSGLETPMSADALQVRSVSTARLINRLGELPESYLTQIVKAVSLTLEGAGV